MARNPTRTVYIGNLDGRVNEKVLYEILIQVGHLVDLYIPRDKETNHHKGYAFAEYETEEIAGYAVSLFSGLVRLHNKTLKFAISGQDKTPQNQTFPVLRGPNSHPLLKPHPANAGDNEMLKASSRFTDNCRVTASNHSLYSALPRGENSSRV